MFGSPSKNTQLNFADSAAVFGSALAVRAEKATLVEFGTGSQEIPFKKSSSVLTLVESFSRMGGTNTTEAVRKHFIKGIHDRVIIVTDEQAMYSYYGNPADQIPSTVPLYNWNLVGYKASQSGSGANRHYFGGLNDQAFKLIPFVEMGADSSWPWED